MINFSFYRSNLFRCATILPFCCLFHPKISEYAYRKYYKKDLKSYFKDDSMEDIINKNLKTGDLILFKRKLSFFKPIRSILILMSRIRLQGEFDHVGIIIYNKEMDEPYVLECGLSGIKYTSFESRIIHSLSKKISIRSLETSKTKKIKFSDQKLSELTNLIENQLKNKKYQKRETFLNIIVSSPHRVDHKHSLYHANCVESSKRKLENLKKKIFSLNMNKEQKIILSKAIKNCEIKIEKHKNKIKDNFKESRLENTNLEIRSASLIAKVYAFLDLIPKEPSYKAYNLDCFNSLNCYKYDELKYASLPIVGDKKLGIPVHFKTD